MRIEKAPPLPPYLPEWKYVARSLVALAGDFANTLDALAQVPTLAYKPAYVCAILELAASAPISLVLFVAFSQPGRDKQRQTETNRERERERERDKETERER